MQPLPNYFGYKLSFWYMYGCVFLNTIDNLWYSRVARSRKSTRTASDDKKSSLPGAVVASNSEEAFCDITDDVSEGQAEALPLVSERPITHAATVEHQPIAVCDLWSYVAQKKLSAVDSLKTEYEVCVCVCNCAPCVVSKQLQKIAGGLDVVKCDCTGVISTFSLHLSVA